MNEKVPDEFLRMARDLTSIPTMGTVEFTSVDGRLERCELPHGMGDGFRFVFWFQVLPMFQFSLPFSVTAIENLGRAMLAGVEEYRAEKKAETSSDS